MAFIASGYPATLDLLLDKIAAKLLADGVVTEESFILEYTLRDDDELFFNPPADRFVMVYPVKFVANKEAHAGGRLETEQYDSIIRVSEWTRIGEDWSALQHDVLKAANKAAIQSWLLVMKALRKFMPTDTDSNQLLIEPMRNLDFLPAPARPDRLGRVKMVGNWSMKFILDLD